MVKSVGEVMTTKIQTIGLEDKAQAAAKQMKNKDVGSLVAADKNEQAVGIVTERDLVRQVCAEMETVVNMKFNTSCHHR